MKVILVLVVIVGLGGVVLYYAGGYESFDPTEQGEQAKAALRPGMSFAQACALTGDPTEYCVIKRKVRRFEGHEIVEMVPTPPMKCTRDRINSRLTEGSLPYGFLCTFTYSRTLAFTLQYDLSLIHISEPTRPY